MFVYQYPTLQIIGPRGVFAYQYKLINDNIITYSYLITYTYLYKHTINFIYFMHFTYFTYFMNSMLFMHFCY